MLGETNIGVTRFWDRSRGNFFSSFVPTEEMQCPGCYGSGVPRNNKSGLNVLCPICLGTGKIRRPRDVTHRRALRI